MNLEESAYTLVADYSHGMRKKLSLAAALLPGPRLLFLDEPFEGIDAVASRQIKDLPPPGCENQPKLSAGLHHAPYRTRWIPGRSPIMQLESLILPRITPSSQQIAVEFRFPDPFSAATALFSGGGVRIGASPDRYYADANDNGMYEPGEAFNFGGPPDLANFMLTLHRKAPSGNH